MPDGTSRITCKVLTDENIVKINPRAPLDSVCLLACGLSTGYGGVTRIANMRIGSSVGVFGCGAVDKPIQQVLKELTGIGLDYTFDCTGNTKITIAALEATKIGTGESIVLGVSDKGEEDIGVALQQLMLGRYWKGGVFGNLIPKRDIPQLVEQYLDNKLEIDSLVTHRFKFVEINEAIKVMMSGDWFVYNHSTSTVNGLLLSEDALSSSDNNADDQIVITDAIPLFHHWTTLTPMLEVGLQQVDIYAKRNKHNVVGYYHGNERVDDNKLPPFGQKIASRIQDTFNNAIANIKLSPEKPEIAILPYIFKENQWRPDNKAISTKTTEPIFKFENSDVANLTAESILAKHFEHLYDFDEHLENIELDWLTNTKVTQLIDNGTKKNK
ncbi:1109_t:CDS:2 [Entrophospora sp. SA101]|nr:1109_t:CDS:2 [Entrophospora sp. SA101]